MRFHAENAQDRAGHGTDDACAGCLHSTSMFWDDNSWDLHWSHLGSEDLTWLGQGSGFALCSWDVIPRPLECSAWQECLCLVRDSLNMIYDGVSGPCRICSASKGLETSGVRPASLRLETKGQSCRQYVIESRKNLQTEKGTELPG